mmetsp:Transcript_11162/g.47627  ORF Transcript_11162/g.47627 Transcript_11162/m.47627 type:complete len:243 (-) Transcript_11162:623-1351(-)
MALKMLSKFMSSEAHVRSTYSTDWYDPTHVARLRSVAFARSGLSHVFVTESQLASTVWFTHPSTHSAFVSTLSSEHRENAPMNSCMPNIPKMSQNSSATNNTFPRPGSDLRSALTTTRSSGTREMTRRGRNTRIVRSARTHEMFVPLSAFPKMPTSTMEPSMTFHASRRYVPDGSSSHTPNAVSFMSISSVKSTVKHQSATSSAPANFSSSIAFGDSNAIKTEDAAMQTMMNASKRSSSTIA